MGEGVAYPHSAAQEANHPQQGAHQSHELEARGGEHQVGAAKKAGVAPHNVGAVIMMEMWGRVADKQGGDGVPKTRVRWLWQLT